MNTNPSHAAIKLIEDTLQIRRLQAREFEHERNNVERITAIRKDIASMEHGLKILNDLEIQGLSDWKSQSHSIAKSPNPPECPTIGDLPANPSVGTNPRPGAGSPVCGGSPRVGEPGNARP